VPALKKEKKKKKTTDFADWNTGRVFLQLVDKWGKSTYYIPRGTYDRTNDSIEFCVFIWYYGFSGITGSKVVLDKKFGLILFYGQQREV